MSSPTHRRQTSVSSAYSLASPISLPPASPSQQSRNASARQSLFSKFGHRVRDRSNSKGHKSNSSEEWEWTCRGEDLEDDFTWPPEGWSEMDTPRTPPLVHSRGSSGGSSFSRFSYDSFDSPAPTTPGGSTHGSASSHRWTASVDGQAGRSKSHLDSLPTVVTDSGDEEEEGEGDGFTRTGRSLPRIQLSKSSTLPPPATALGSLPPVPAQTESISFQPASIQPLRLSKSQTMRPLSTASGSSVTSSATIDEDGLRRRKADEELAIEAIGNLFKRSSIHSSSETDLPIRPSRTKPGFLPAPPPAPPSRLPSFDATPTQDTVRRLGSPFERTKVAPSQQQQQQQKRPSNHQRRPAHAFTMVSDRAPVPVDRPTSLVSVDGEPSQEQRRPSYTSPDCSSEDLEARPKSSAYYDFI